MIVVIVGTIKGTSVWFKVPVVDVVQVAMAVRTTKPTRLGGPHIEDLVVCHTTGRSGTISGQAGVVAAAADVAVVMMLVMMMVGTVRLVMLRLVRWLSLIVVDIVVLKAVAVVALWRSNRGKRGGSLGSDVNPITVLDMIEWLVKHRRSRRGQSGCLLDLVVKLTKEAGHNLVCNFFKK